MAHNVVESADAIVVLSLDSLFSLPEYRTDEKILYLVTEMAEKLRGDGKVLLQTRLTKMPIMKHIGSHTFLDFYRETLRERNEAHLPPQYTVIKATLHNLADELKAKLEEVCHEYEPLWYEAGAGKTLLFLHIPEKRWEEDQVLRSKLHTILSFGVPRVNPLHFFS
jgi:primosomal protein N'